MTGLTSADHHLRLFDHAGVSSHRTLGSPFSTVKAKSLHLPKATKPWDSRHLNLFFPFTLFPMPGKAKSSTAWCCTTPLPTIPPWPVPAAIRLLAGATMVFGFWFERSTRCVAGLTWFFLCAGRSPAPYCRQANFSGPRLSSS